MQEQQKFETEKLVLEGRKYLTMTGVESVDWFSEQCLKLTVSGVKVIIGGENVKISSFNKAAKNLTVEGTINEIKYSIKRDAVIKRIFK